jgi:hypothetical protein
VERSLSSASREDLQTLWCHEVILVIKKKTVMTTKNKEAVGGENDKTYKVIEQIEKHCVVCPRCGGDLEGRIVPFQPEYKYCDSCRFFVVDWFAMNLFLPDGYLLKERS